MFTKKTIKDIDLKDKTVLLRTDYNVPLENGKISDDYRIKQSLPTIQYLLENNVKLVICSHLGRPDGKPNAAESLFPVAKRLQELLGKDVEFVPDCIGERVAKVVRAMKPGQVVLLENLRFHAQEEQNDATFAKQLAGPAQVFVQDGFGVVHRAHASTAAITQFLPSVAGLLLEKEVDTITSVMQNPKRPLLAIIGGAKIADKIDILHKFIDIADFVAIGGAMANTFLAAEGVDIAKSTYEQTDVPVAKDIIKKARMKAKAMPFVFALPHDAVVAHKVDKAAPTRIVDWTAHVVAEIESYPKRPSVFSGRLEDNEMILDIGPFSASFIAGGLQLAGTVIWNGTMGVTETPNLHGPVGPTAHGTELIIEAITGEFGHRPYSLVGGGDTSGYIESRGLMNSFDHVSTGGGASLELMAGHKLPGVEALEAK
jgi:phosphoglycerate kinase